MTLVENIISNQENLKQDKNFVQRAKNFYLSIGGGKPELNDFQLSFLNLLGGDKYMEVYTVELSEAVVPAFREHYRSSRINDHHVYQMGLHFPTENSNEWEMVFGIEGGDTVVLLQYEEWEFKRLIIN